MGDFGQINVTQMHKVDHWVRAIRRYRAGFGYTLLRGPGGGVVKAQIRGDPLGKLAGSSSLPTSEHTSFDEFFRAMHHLSIYYQVGTPWSRPVGPPPNWMTTRAQDFWWDVSEHPEKYSRTRRRWVERFGPKLTIKVTWGDGTTKPQVTRAQLIWLDVVPGDARALRATEISMKPFHYLPVATEEDDLIRQRVNVDWNHSMYHYIEEQLLHPDVALQKLAAVNRELHKILMKAFFGGGGGSVKVSGLGDDIATLIQQGHDLWSWHEDYTKPENEAMRDWYRKYLANQQR